MSAPFDEAHTVWTGKDSSMRQADEQAVLHHAGNLREARRQIRRIGNTV